MTATNAEADLIETSLLPEEVSRVAAQSPPRVTPYLVVLRGASRAREYRLSPGHALVGRAADNHILIEDDNVSRRHAIIVCCNDGSVFIEDLGSTNGTLIDGERVHLRYLKGGERLRFGSQVLLKFELRDPLEEELLTDLYESATQDALTGVYNARYFRDQLRAEFAWHHRQHRPLALLLLDVDHFKRVNDEHGHLAGDEVLRQLAAVCRELVRAEDVFARYGGEEFVCLLRQTTAESGTLVAERMRRAVERWRFRVDGKRGRVALPVTVSVGVAQLEPRMLQPETLVEAADRLLYRAKHAGRNRVESHVLEA